MKDSAIFKLTATLNGETRETHITGYATHEAMNLVRAANPSAPPVEVRAEAIKFDATMSAIAFIMNNGYKRVIWGKGEIKLYDEDGNVVHEMEAK